MLPTHKSYITVIHSFGKYLLSIFNVASACLDTTHYLSFLFKVSTAFSRTVPILRSTSQRCVSCDCNLFHHSARLATSGCCKTSHDCRSHGSRKWILVWCDVIWNPVEANHTAFRFLFKASSLLCHLIYGSELYSQVCNMLPPEPKEAVRCYAFSFVVGGTRCSNLSLILEGIRGSSPMPRPLNPQTLC